MRLRRVPILLPVLVVFLLAPTIASADTHQITERLRENMPPFVFTLEYTREQRGDSQADASLYADEGAFFYIHSIRVTREDNGGEVQRITLDPPAETFADEEYSGFGLVLEDMDFDSFLDMRLMQFVSAGANIPYYCWLWDPSAQRFVYNEALSEISSPLFDPAEKQVLGFSNNGAAEYIDSFYEYRDADLVLVARTTTGYDYEGGTVIVTTEELVNGQMTIVDVTKGPLVQPEEGDFNW